MKIRVKADSMLWREFGRVADKLKNLREICENDQVIDAEQLQAFSDAIVAWPKQDFERLCIMASRFVQENTEIVEESDGGEGVH